MKKLLVCVLILATVSSTEVMCFAMPLGDTYFVSDSKTPLDVSTLPPKYHFENFIEDLYEFSIEGNYEDAVKTLEGYENDLRQLFYTAFFDNTCILEDFETSIMDVLASSRRLSNSKFQFYDENRTNVKRICRLVGTAIQKMEKMYPYY